MSHIKNQGIIYIANGTNPNSLGITPVGDLGIVKTQDGTQEWNYNVSLAPGSRWVLKDGGKKVYKALLTQSGTEAPVATVLENTLGEEIVWSRESPGVYTSSSLPQNKTFLLFTRCPEMGSRSNIWYAHEDGLIIIHAYNISNTVTSDNVLSDFDGYNKTMILIEVYP